MSIMMQGFYWDCPRQTNQEGKWWSYVQTHLAKLATVGVDRLWLPPAQKSFSWNHMGYDPYDYYDLGEFAQKGNVATWFGTKVDLLALIKEAHSHNIQVIADLVLNHNSGGEREFNPNLSRILGQETYTWTKFAPASGKFLRNYDHFHPSSFAQNDQGTFADMPDLCHLHPHVYSEILQYAKWLMEEVGYDGFRYDCVKAYNDWIVFAIHSYLGCFGVGEYWDDEYSIEDWLDDVDYQCQVFDFPLRNMLTLACNDSSFSLTELRSHLLEKHPEHTITFVENHDTDKEMPLINDKMLAYSYILTHQGEPCIFWRDYFDYQLAQPGTPHGIDALLAIRRNYVGGNCTKLHCDDTLYVMAREVPDQKGIVYVLNKGKQQREISVTTAWHNTVLSASAWRKTDEFHPSPCRSDDQGRVTLHVPARGYVVYIPQFENEEQIGM